ncbi:MAG: aminopeptidase P family protein [Chthonomonadales bacterium]|nr:aminopeptidase P family protein [Chthonomonadales bacterium]
MRTSRHTLSTAAGCPALVLLALSAAAVAAAVAAWAPMFGLSSGEFARRRERVRAAAGDAVVLLRGPTENEDSDRSRFRTDSDLLYLTGVEAPGAWLALLPPGSPAGAREILFLPGEPAGAPRPYPLPGREAERETGIERVLPAAEMWRALEPAIRAAAVISVEPSGDDLAPGPPGALEARLRAIRPAIAVEPTAASFIHPLRRVKSPGEVANLRAAVRATVAGQMAAARALRAGRSELEVEGAILAAFRGAGAVREGFPCVVASGPDAVSIHHLAGARPVRAGELAVVDIGAEVNYYTADLTRTWPVGGRFSRRQRELYELVLDTQRACAESVVPGRTTLRDLQRRATAHLRASPLRAADGARRMSTMDRFFTHGIGHWLGMDVHDVGSIEAPIEPGVVLTIEPGVYIPSERTGIRIEDDYLVTERGIEKLSNALPSGVVEVEAAMRGMGAAPAARGERRPRLLGKDE